ncbi:MAG: glycogen-binding domain-containing protein [Candidatus Dormibacteraeota bacterium]|nr:glycogen-binding domain-containing protein [Candidatus Dormibacteraeota bacterium]
MSIGTMPARAQARASMGVGVGTLRTETGSSFSSASLFPAVQYTTPALVARASGYVASLPTGVWAGQGRLQLWGATPRVTGRWRLGAEGSVGGTTRTGGSWTSATHGLGELFWSSSKGGFGLGAGPSAGWIANEPSVVALHTRARAWWRPGGKGGATDWQLSVEPTRFFGEWFTDVGAGVSVRRGPAMLSLATETRLSQAYGSTAAGSAFLQLFVGPVVSLELGGGSYLREPYQGFPRGTFFSLGLRLGSTRPAPATAAKRLAPLLPDLRGDSLVVQFRFRDVRTVAIAGNWDDWQTHALRRVSGDLWQGKFALTRGLYHFNLLVDGRKWVVPRGVTTVPDGLGGKVAVLLVR